MYLFPVHVQDSVIEGKGVFSSQKIPKGEVVWKYVPGHDLTLSVEEHAKLDDSGKEYIEKVAYLSVASHQYIYPPENDPALYANHSESAHNLTVVHDSNISLEPFFVANRDTAEGEELTNNYHEFDISIDEHTRPDWLKK